jgi:DNA (cytosine-5)-methyltransferase 1
MAFAQNQLGELRTNSEVMGTVNTNQNASGRNTPMVMQPLAFKPKFFTRDNAKMEGAPRKDGSIRTLLTNDTGDNAPHVATHSSVRRLTPRECERLQGFPDDYTLVTYRNKPAADGPRYKALGNSMAVPVMRWIGERIASVDSLNGAT